MDVGVGVGVGGFWANAGERAATSGNDMIATSATAKIVVPAYFAFVISIMLKDLSLLSRQDCPRMAIREWVWEWESRWDGPA